MHSLLFELNSIQAYLFSSGKLRDMVGASELLDRLTNRDSNGNLLDSVVQAAGIEGQIAFSRRAGGAFYAFSDDAQAIDALRRLWTLAVQQWAPGLSFSIAQGKGGSHAEAFKEARQNLNKDASRVKPQLPVAAPVAHRVGRTGGVAVEYQKKKQTWLDAPSSRFKMFAKPDKAAFLDRFAPEGAKIDWRDWPLDLEGGEGDLAFPFNGEDRTIAVIHADGNGLGQVLRTLGEAAKKPGVGFIQIFSDLSELIEQSTQAAARAATAEVLIPARSEGQCLAARPLLLGGDDITVLVRADLALDYIKSFSQAFEKESAARLRGMAIDGLPEKLTLGFGVVFMRASQPFHMAIDLCEQLMKEGKKTAKAIDEKTPPATLVFHRVTSSLVNDYKQILNTELAHQADGEVYRDTLGAYGLKENERLPNLADLEALAALLGQDDMARGPTRQLLTLMGHSIHEARRRYKRWRLLMEENKLRRLETFDALMEKLVREEMLKELPYSTKQKRSPLGDALALMGAGVSAGGDTQTDEQKEEAA